MSTTSSRTKVTATATGDEPRPRIARTTGVLLLVSTGAFLVAATVLSMTFDWPDILREPANVVLPEFADGGTGLVWTWFAVAWTYAILLVPILLLPAALDRRDDVALRAATFAGAISVVLALIGFLRWVFVVPPLADAYVAGGVGARRRSPRHGPRNTSTAARCWASTSDNCSASRGR